MVGLGGVVGGIVQGIFFGFDVRAVEEVEPCVSDVRRVAVVGGLVDEDAEVEVAGLVGVLVVELGLRY